MKHVLKIERMFKKEMKRLPEKFPEYSIMYKTLSKQIEKLKQQRDNAHESEIDEIEVRIQRYESEIMKIMKKFPSDYFEGID